MTKIIPMTRTVKPVEPGVADSDRKVKTLSVPPPDALAGDKVAIRYWERFAPLLEWYGVTDPETELPEQYDDLIEFCTACAARDFYNALKYTEPQAEVKWSKNVGLCQRLKKKLKFSAKPRVEDAEQENFRRHMLGE